MDLLPAVIAVLRAEGGPLHVDEITRRIIANGSWLSRGKTPAATVGARIYVDIKQLGEASAFVKAGKQIFALRSGAAEPPPAPVLPQATAALPAAAPSVTVPASLSFTDAAERVLAQSAGKKPLHYRQITELALKSGLLSSNGKTPEATLYAQIITEIRRQQKRGERPRFVQHGRGFIGLSRWMGSGLVFQIEQHNHQVRKALRERLLKMEPSAFEELVSRLLVEMGFDSVEVTRVSGDGGIDVRGTLVVGDVVRIKMAVQVKRWKLSNNVQAPTVQQVRGSLGIHEQGLIITTSDFSAGAVREAAQPDKTPIALMNGKQLVALLLEHEIGVQLTNTALFELDDETLANDVTG